MCREKWGKEAETGKTGWRGEEIGNRNKRKTAEGKTETKDNKGKGERMGPESSTEHAQFSQPDY